MMANHDAFAEALDRALRDPGLTAFADDTHSVPTGESTSAALRLAIALGRCRLYGVETPLDGTLPANVAQAAAKELAQVVAEWQDSATSLEHRFYAVDPIESETMACDLVEQRSLIWAAMEAIEEAIDAADEAGSNVDELDLAADRATEEIAKHDEVLQTPEVMQILATVAGTSLLESTRENLDPQYQEMLPWWLDGTLEKISEAIVASVEGDIAEPPVQVSTSNPGSGPVFLLPSNHQIAEPPAHVSTSKPWFYLPSLAASTLRDDVPFVRWISPDGRLHAIMRREARSGDESVCVTFSVVATQKRANGLSSQPVALGDLLSTIDLDAKAWFETRAVIALAKTTEEPPPLIVGSERVVWRFDS